VTGGISQWISFGASGLVTALPRDEQRKMIKYTHLVANLLIFHTTVSMTRALDAIRADSLGDAITDEALAGLSPYPTEHINRFGSYVLDLTRPPEPLPIGEMCEFLEGILAVVQASGLVELRDGGRQACWSGTERQAVGRSAAAASRPHGRGGTAHGCRIGRR
jgi:hypothetical protein